MDVTRLVEEVKSALPAAAQSLVNEDVYMSTTFSAFVDRVVILSRGGGETVFEFDAVKLRVNNLDLEFPHQVFINNQFVDAISGKTSKVSLKNFWKSWQHLWGNVTQNRIPGNISIISKVNFIKSIHLKKARSAHMRQNSRQKQQRKFVLGKAKPAL